MSQKSSAPAAAVAGSAKPPVERVVRDIRRRTRKHHSAEVTSPHRVIQAEF